MALDPRLRYPNEQPLFILGAVFSGFVWLALVLTIVGIFYGLIGFGLALVAHALYLANVRGNAVRVSDRQFPELYARCQQAAKALGLVETPEIYLMQADGALNAFATKLFSRRFVIIYSDLVDECQDPRQLDFVVAHEMGHIAAGHLQWMAFLWPFMLVPWAGAAYMRAREYTSDRCGFFVVDDLETSMRGLIVLAAGGRQAARADVPAFMEQRKETGQFWSAVLELVSTHPYLCKRVAALQELSQPGSAPAVPRNILAYPLAPVLGLAAAGPAGGAASLLVVVAMIGIIAAIAIPSLLRARVSANEAGTLTSVRTLVAAQTRYAAANQGFYDSREECLLAPASCIPGYAGAAFLEEGVTQTPRQGYRLTLHAGRTFAPGEAPANTSPSSTSGFVVLALPLKPGTTGVRAFCGDSSGRVCAATGPAADALAESLEEEPWIQCSSGCTDLD
jgi:Zn-dependent protease with chaperone function/type II secretory pathway pseudopilin PulG